jgi:urease accessory protein
MEIVPSQLGGPPAEGEEIVAITADRMTLAKRRWRGVAADNREFGFDLGKAISHGDVVFREASRCYVVSQAPEPVLEVALEGSPARNASIAWQIGNLHFPIEITESVIRVPDDTAIRRMLEREGIAYSTAQKVFQPMPAAAHGHHHSH